MGNRMTRRLKQVKDSASHVHEHGPGILQLTLHKKVSISKARAPPARKLSFLVCTPDNTPTLLMYDTDAFDLPAPEHSTPCGGTKSPVTLEEILFGGANLNGEKYGLAGDKHREERAAFTEFLRTRYCIESLDFYIAELKFFHYHARRGPDENTQTAAWIYDNMIEEAPLFSSESPPRIFLPADMRRDIRRSIENAVETNTAPPLEIFDAARNHVLEELKNLRVEQLTGVRLG